MHLASDRTAEQPRTRTVGSGCRLLRMWFKVAERRAAHTHGRRLHRTDVVDFFPHGPLATFNASSPPI
jgi:hypothetical protein